MKTECCAALFGCHVMAIEMTNQPVSCCRHKESHLSAVATTERMLPKLKEIKGIDNLKS